MTGGYELKRKGRNLVRIKPTAITWVRIVCYAVLFAALTCVFYEECIGAFHSDMPTHIDDALGKNSNTSAYSLMAPAIAAAYALGGNVAVAIMFGIVEVLTVALCERFVRKLLPDASPGVVLAIALLCNVAIAIWLPFAHRSAYKGVIGGNVWHNSTYLGMRPLALLAIWFYLRIIGRLPSNRPAADWVLFAAFALLSVGAKPSFIVVFGPTLVVLCIADLVREGRSTLKRSLGFAAVMVLALAILYWQSTVLYSDDQESGFAIGLAVVWAHYHDCVPLAMLQSFAFPLIALVGCRGMLTRDRSYALAWIMFVIALAVYLFLYETGPRIWHGNLEWSLLFAQYYLVIASAVAFVRTRWDHMPFTRASSEAPKPLRAYDVATMAVFGLHALSGIAYIAFIIMYTTMGYQPPI